MINMLIKIRHCKNCCSLLSPMHRIYECGATVNSFEAAYMHMHMQQMLSCLEGGIQTSKRLNTPAISVIPNWKLVASLVSTLIAAYSEGRKLPVREKIQLEHSTKYSRRHATIRTLGANTENKMLQDVLRSVLEMFWREIPQIPIHDRTRFIVLYAYAAYHEC